MRLNILSAALLGLGLLGTTLPAPVRANPFAPRLLVGESVITRFEFEQRRRFLELLGAQGDLDEMAENALIEDRLRMLDASRVDLKPSPEAIRAGMEEFAARAGLTAEEFVAALEENGVAAQTFRDFVAAGVIWRDIVRGRFSGSVGSVSEAEIDRALSVDAQKGPLMRAEIAEIVLPSTRTKLAQELADTVRGEAAFAAAAREHSIADSAENGGLVGWVPAGNLPQAVVAQLSGLGVGAVSQPVRVAEGIAVYQLRGLEQHDAVTPGLTEVDYAMFLIPGARTPEALAEGLRIRAQVDACDDLYAVARGLPPERLIREKVARPALPADVAAELAKLDPGESSLALVRGGYTALLMLCSQRVASAIPADRDAVRERIMNERLSAMAEIYLAKLRANTHIRRP